MTITPMPIPGAKPKAKTRKAWFIPLVVAALTGYFDFRLKSEKQLAETGYSAVAAPMKEMQTQINTLGTQVQLLQQLVLVMSQERQHVERAPRRGLGGGLGTLGGAADIEIKSDASPALAKFKHDLVVNVAKSQGKPMMQQQIPNRLEDVAAKK
jgi:hypothetical protein